MVSMSDILRSGGTDSGPNSATPEQIEALQRAIRKYGLSDALLHADQLTPQPVGLFHGQELRNYERPGSNSVEQRAARGAAEGAVVLSGAPLVIGAGQDLAQAAQAPTRENLINAGVDLAILPLALAPGPGRLMRPRARKAIDKTTAVGGAALIGAGAVAGADDALAAERLNRQQRREMEIERQRSDIAAKLKEAEIKADAEAEARRIAAETDAKIRAADAEAKRRQEEEKAAVTTAEYERQVKLAESMRDKALARDVRFSDNPVGKIARSFGGLDNAAAGAFAAALARAAPRASGRLGRFLQHPLTAGGTGGVAAANFPTWYEAKNSETLNPQWEAYRDYGFLLPEGHPDKERYTKEAEKLEQSGLRLNPVKEEAKRDLGEGFVSRSMWGGLEGMAGGLMGHDAVAAAQGGGTYLGRILRGATNIARGGGAPAARQRIIMTPYGARNAANGQWVKRP